MLSLVDYGLGNIRAFANVYKRLNIPFEIASDVQALRRAQRLVLPGVGAFDWAMNKLNQSGMRDTLDELVLGQKRPVIGICVGMQMMAKGSEEGREPGLGWLDADVRRLTAPRSNERVLLPHMGWNDAAPARSHPLFSGLDDPRFYFLHSFYFAPRAEGTALARTFYHQNFTSAAAEGNVIGVQFHPEKSHDWGVRLLKNFAGL